MKPSIPGRPKTHKQTQPLQENNSAQDSPAVGSTGTAEKTQRNLPYRPSAYEKALRAQADTTLQGTRKSPTVDGQDSTPGPSSTPTGAKRKSTQTHLPPSTRAMSVQRTAQDQPSTGSLLDSRAAIPQGLQASHAVPLNQGALPEEPMNLDTDDEAYQLILELGLNLSEEDEQVLNHQLTDETTAAAAKVARPVPQQEPSDSESMGTGTSYAGVNLNQCQTLGYTKKQARAIKPENRAEVIKHHQSLIDKGFRHEQIVKVSRRAQSLEFLVTSLDDLFLKLPDLEDDHVLDIAKGRYGDLVLETLLLVADDLKGEPLLLNTAQLVRIARRGERAALLAVHSLRHELMKPPHPLNTPQVVAIASNGGGKQALEAVKKLLPELTQGANALSTAQVVAIASKGGKQALQAVKTLLPELTQAPYNLSTAQVVTIADNYGSKQALETVKKLLPELTQAPYNLSTAQVVAIASNIGGKQALETVKALLPKLTQDPYNLSIEQVVAIANNGGGRQALEAVKTLLPELTQGDNALSTAQVVAIACNDGGQQALEAVKTLLPELTQGATPLSTAQVVAIASNHGGKQALETVKRLLPELTQAPYNLSTEQVVAIASHDGGQQALEAVKMLLPDLTQAPYNLSIPQVVAAASNNGCKQALEAIKAAYVGPR